MKRFLKGIAIAALVLSLRACGKAAPPASSTAHTGAAPQSAGEPWVPIGSPDAPVTVKIVIKDVFPAEEEQILLSQAIEEKMASHGQYVKIAFQEPPAGSYKTALPLAVMNSEIDADLIYFQGGDTAAAAQGLLEDLTPYIDSSVFVKNLMDTSNQLKLENYPYLLWLSPPRASTPAIRTDWAKAMDSFQPLMENPTVENYLAFFQELKDRGLCSYAITADGGLDRLDSIFNHAFGVTGTVVKENGKWIFSKASQAEKQKLAFYAELYARGLLDPNFLTNTWDVMEQRWYNGDAAIVAGTAGAVVQIYDTKMRSLYGEEAALTILPPAAGVSQSYTSIDTTKESRGIAINADSKNKDAAWAVLEFMASPEGRLLDKVGIENVHYQIVDNQIVFTDRFDSWWARFWDTTSKFEPEIPLAEPVMSPAAVRSLEMVDEYAAMDTNILIPEEMTPQWDAMVNLYNEYASDVVRGVKNIDSFDTFAAEWNQAGGDAFSDLLAEKLS